MQWYEGHRYGEGYTERDIAAKLHGSKTSVNNAIIMLSLNSMMMAHFMTGKGLVIHRRLMSRKGQKEMFYLTMHSTHFKTPREDWSMRQIVMCSL